MQLNDCPKKVRKNISIAIFNARLSVMKDMIGSVIEVSGKPISVGYNDYYGSRNGYSLHAEKSVIMQFKKLNVKHKNRKINIYTVKIDKEGNLKNAYPCYKCIEVMKQYSIKKVIYSNNDGCIEVSRFRDLIDNKPYYTFIQRMGYI